MANQVTTELNDVCELVRTAESNYVQGNIQTSKYVTEDFYEDIQTIEAYLNSKHISGETDSLEREKPFFNIVLAARNIWYRATDIDRKNIKAEARKAKDALASYIYTIHLQQWMKDENFGRFLNDWGLYLASYNSAVCKFVEKDGRLIPMVMDWNKIIVDTIDFDNNIKIEILELTPAQLRKREGYDKEMVDKLIEATGARENIEGQKKDLQDNYIKLYEVHGELPLSYLTGKDSDAEDYVQQMHVVSFIASKEAGKFDDYTLYSGREKQDPYILTYLIGSIDGSISLMGSVKSLFEAQWMVNHSIKLIKDQLDLASKMIFLTADPAFVGQNALSAVETGDFLVFNKDIPDARPAQLQNNSHDITSLQNFGMQWQNLAQQLVATPDIMSGTNMPSGTAYRQAAIIQQEAHSNYEIMVENKGLFLEEMFKRYITPFLMKKMDTTDEITATLDAYGIDKIDMMYISAEATKRYNEKMVEAVINDQELPDLGQEQQGVAQELSMQGAQRFIKPSEIEDVTWKDMLKEFEADVKYEITNENTEKQVTFDTLTSLLNTIATNPLVLQDPNGKMLFNKILEATNVVSPIEIREVQSKPAIPMQGGQMVGAGNNNQTIQL